MQVKIFTDGSCLDNSRANVENFGAYGIIVLVNGKVFKKHSEAFQNTTNNEMELLGLLTGIKIAKLLGGEAHLYADSAYCVNIVNDWMYKWAARNWTKADNKTPENLKIIKEIYELMNFEPNIHIHKTKGHSDDLFHNMADKEAIKASREAQTNYLLRKKVNNGR